MSYETTWMVHVAGGSQNFGCPSGKEAINVQYAFAKWPPTAVRQSVPEVQVITAFDNPPSVQDPKFALRECYASWNWESQQICSSGQVDVGGSLGLGIPFASDFICGLPLSFTQINVLAKYRVHEPTTRISSVRLNVSDVLGNIDAGQTVVSITCGWQTICTQVTSAQIAGWDTNNLRVNLTFSGAMIAANAGVTTVDVEYFAFRLRVNP